MFSFSHTQRDEPPASDICSFYDNTHKHTDKTNGEKRGRTAAPVLVLADVASLLMVVALPVSGNKMLPSVSLRKLLKLLSVVKLMTLCRVCLFEFSKERTAA